jgi:putative tricarboxylic transport membrane protein
MRERSWTGPRIAGLVLLGIGVVALVATFAIRSPTGWAVDGPRLMPLVVSIGLIGFALAFLARVTFWPDTALAERAAEEERATHWPTPGLLAVALVAYALLLSPLGYVIATALLFPAAAWVLGSRRQLRDVIAGAAVALVLYYAFTYHLGVGLPAGPLPF